MKNNSILSHGLILIIIIFNNIYFINIIKNFFFFVRKIVDCGLWNRDENSARNIYKIAKNAICKKERPNYLILEHTKIISGTNKHSLFRYAQFTLFTINKL